MARKLRLEFPGARYHIINRGNYRRVSPRLVNEGTIAGGLPNTTDGRRAPNVPLDDGYIIASWDLGQVGLRGFAFHTGLIYDGISYPESTSTTAGEYSIVIPSYFTIEAGLEYHWTQPLFRTKFNHSVGFSVDNLANRDYLDAGDNPGATRGCYFHYKIVH